MSKHCFEALDRTLSDIMMTSDEKPFGGKVVVLEETFNKFFQLFQKVTELILLMLQ